MSPTAWMKRRNTLFLASLPCWLVALGASWSAGYRHVTNFVTSPTVWIGALAFVASVVLLILAERGKPQAWRDAESDVRRTKRWFFAYMLCLLIAVVVPGQLESVPIRRTIRFGGMLLLFLAFYLRDRRIALIVRERLGEGEEPVQG